MLAIRATQAGGPEVLEAVDVPLPEPRPGQILIRHQAIGLNYIDTYQRSGLYPVKFPAVLGQEAAGVVEQTGEGVERFKVGDRVAYTGQTGAYAEYSVVPAARGRSWRNAAHCWPPFEYFSKSSNSLGSAVSPSGAGSCTVPAGG